MKKNEWILIGIILVIAAGLFAATKLISRGSGEQVVISVDGDEYAVLNLREDTVYEIKGEHGESNIVEIKDGIVRMIEASCPDLLCVHQNAIHLNNEMIVCLPNRVVVEIKGTKERKVDTVVN